MREPGAPCCHARPLTADSFAPFGDVLAAAGTYDRLINGGKCERFHDRACLDFTDARAGVSVFRAALRAFPYSVDLLERHPLGSQTFIPMCANGFLVIVAQDRAGVPVNPQAFVTAPGQAINFHRGTWHGVLTPLAGSGLFAVVDRIGAGANLEEYPLTPPLIILGPTENGADPA